MGSSSSYESASSYVGAVWSADRTELRDRTRSVREDFKKGVVTERSVFTGRDSEKVYDAAAVKLAISSVPAAAKRAYVIAVDNSASNTVIAQGFRSNSGYLLGVLKSIDPEAAVATIYFSDICDGPLVSQEVDFVMPTPEGDKTLHSSLRKVADGNGGDIPEAIAEAMIRASEIDLESIPKADRHFILVTDSVPHGMEGFTEMTDYADDYPNSQVPWRRGVGAIRAAFGSFSIIGSGAEPVMREFQRRLFETAPGVISESEVATNFLDLSDIRQAKHRNGLVGNMVLFLAARSRGAQAVEGFLRTLYVKWLESPVFGERSAELAKGRIESFRPYLHGYLPDARIQAIFEGLFAE